MNFSFFITVLCYHMLYIYLPLLPKIIFNFFLILFYLCTYAKIFQFETNQIKNKKKFASHFTVHILFKCSTHCNTVDANIDVKLEKEFELGRDGRCFSTLNIFKGKKTLLLSC